MFKKSHHTPLLLGEKMRFVFLYQIPSFWPSWESVYRACIDDARFDMKLVWVDKETCFNAQMSGAQEFLEENHLAYIKYSSFNLEAYNPHVIVVQSPYDSTHRIRELLSLRLSRVGARIVYIPYGIEITDDGKSDRLNHFYSFVPLNAWRIYVISEQMAELYKAYCPNRTAVRICGHPKFDAYTNQCSKQLSADVEQRINGRPIVLWKMHFPKTWGNAQLKTPHLDEYRKFISMIPNFMDLFFIFMPHPLMLAKSSMISPSLQAESDEIISLLCRMENVYMHTHSDYRSALLRSDAIIIDRSALMIEAGVTGNPILYMSNSDHAEKITDAFVPLVESYYQGTTADDMVYFIKQFQNGCDPKKEQREHAFCKCVPYRDGRCGERIANDIINSIVYESKSCLKFKIAIFCIGDLFRYYWEETDFFKSNYFDIVVFSDNNPSLWGTCFNEIPIVEPQKLREFSFDKIIIFSELYFIEIFQQLVYDICIDMDCIERLDKFLVEPDR